MKKLFLGGAALVALATPAFTADRGVPAYAPPVPAPTYTNWSGCYAGGVAGASWGTSNRTAVVNTSGGAGLPITGDFGLSGFTGGFDGGCNWQAGVWVFGVEGDWSATNLSGQHFGGPPFAPGRIHETQERWVATARARLGWTIWDRSMIYVSGGAAWTKVDDSVWRAIDPIGEKNIETHQLGGWVIGAGLEYALGYGWSARGEYLYEDFGTHLDFNPANGNLTNFRLYEHVVRAGLNYKFW
jgi:outer membrane immunogenic protein